jgi:hypothetical protein
MGEEFAAKGSNVQLGPGLNVARVPNNGRNFECVNHILEQATKRASEDRYPRGALRDDANNQGV